MKINTLSLLVIAILISCNSPGQNADNKKPMYGEVQKNKEQIKLDEEFINTCLEQFGSLDSSVNVHIDLAWRYYYNNDLETSMKRFNQVWLLNPEIPDSYFGFASLMESNGNKNEAKRFYKIAKEKDVNKARTQICYQRIADCKEQLGDINGTINAYTELTISNPTNAFAYKKLGFFQMQIGENNKALESYNTAIKLDPNDAMTYNNRAYLNQTQKKYLNAIEDYTFAIELNPNYISAIVNRGITEMQIDQYENAKLDFEQCVILDPKAGELRRFLGLAELALNNKSKACENFELALGMGDKGVIQLISENCEN